MRKFVLLVCLLLVSGCVTVGEFPENRERLHEMGNNEKYCQKYPARCYLGTPW